MISLVTDINAIDIEQWSDFVHRHSYGNIFQSPELYAMYDRTKNYSPSIILLFENNKIVGCLLSVLISEHNGFFCKFSARSIVIGGPLVDGDRAEFMHALLSEYDLKIKNKTIYSQFRNMHNVLILNNCFQKLGYKFESHLNFLIDLKSTESILWDRIGKGRKKQINKAIKNNLKVEALDSIFISDDILSLCYNVLVDVYKKAKLPLAHKDLFISARDNRILELFLVKKEDEVLGCRFALKYNQCLFGWFAGSYHKYYSLFPNDILIWETLRWGRTNNFHIFDYGGAGSPNKPYGVRDFKAQLGGELVNYGRYEKVHKPFLMYIGRICFKLYKLIAI